MAPEVLVPSSAAEAVALFGDGAATTVIGGGTVVVPDITYGRLSPARVLLLSRAGLDGITHRRDEGHDRRDDSRRRTRSASRITCRPWPPAPRTSRTTRFAARPPSAGTSVPRTARIRRAATSRARCSRSTRRCARRAPTGNEQSPSRSSSRIAMRGSCSTSRSSCRRRRRSPRSSIRIRTSTPCSPSPAPAPPTARSGSRRPARGTRRAPALRRGGAPATSRRPARQRWTTSRSPTTRSRRAWYRQQTLPVLVRRVLTQLEESA